LGGVSNDFFASKNDREVLPMIFLPQRHREHRGGRAQRDRNPKGHRNLLSEIGITSWNKKLFTWHLFCHLPTNKTKHLTPLLSAFFLSLPIL
jgi:hypothetical protein